MLNTKFLLFPQQVNIDVLRIERSTKKLICEGNKYYGKSFFGLKDFRFFRFQKNEATLSLDESALEIFGNPQSKDLFNRII